MPRKIALLIHALHGGGAERLMSQLASRWSEANEVHLLTWADVATDRYSIPSSVRRYGFGLQCPSQGLLGGIRANWTRVRQLRAKLRELDPDFILSFSDQMNIVALEASRGLGKPLWISEHSDPARQRLSLLWEAWRRRTYPSCTGCVVLTRSVAETLGHLVPANRMRIIPPAISPPADLVSSGGSKLVNENEMHFLYVGRLSQEKGVDVLLEAWRRLAGKAKSWRLVIAGDGEQRRALQFQARELEGVEFLGWVDDPWPLYVAADCFVLPSRYEGFPVALLEAMRAGKAVVATRCTAALDKLTNGSECLLLAATESPDDLAEQMLRVVNDPSLRWRLEAAARRVAAEYCWTKIGPKWDAILETPRQAH